jgi:hypothetical protein
LTLILTHLSRAWAVQVTDRLVSRSAAGRTSPFDAEANKNVIFLTDRALVSIGYTGLSYISGVPTDEWIAQILLGEKVVRTPRGTPTLLTFNSPRRRLPSMGPALYRLSNRLATEYRGNATLRKVPVKLSISGWLGYRRKEARPISCIVEPGDPTRYRISWLAPRYLGKSQFVSAVPKGYLQPGELQDLLSTLSGVPNPTAAEKVLVEKIRAVAGRNPSNVGADCMSIALSPPQFGQAIVRYVPATPASATVTLPTGRVELPLGYTPWIVSASVVQAAGVWGDMTGTSLVVGGWRIAFEGPVGPIVDGLSFAQSQERPPPPR